jgi:hypothetical protein
MLKVAEAALKHMVGDLPTWAPKISLNMSLQVQQYELVLLNYS